MSARPVPFALLALACCGVACGDSAEVSVATESTQPVREPVVAQAIEALAAQLESGATQVPAADPELVEELVLFLASSDARTRELPLEEIAGVGDGALPELARMAIDTEREAGERAAAIELLAAVGTRAAGMELVALCNSKREPWVRSHAAWRLSELSPEIDVVIPGLLLRLRSESNHEAAIYVAAALAVRGNFAGLGMLSRLATEDADEAARTRAAGQLAAIVAREGAADAQALIAQWHGLAPGLEQQEPSPHLRLAAWRWIATLSGDTFQLRPVDDGRFLLSRLGPWAVEPLTLALADADPYTRLHCAQCLERMGPVARPALPALTAALTDTRLGPQAARCLGAIGGPGARQSLQAALAGDEHEVRVAAARALGVLVDPSSLPPLGALLDTASEPLDLRQAVAEALILIDATDLAATRFLVACMTDPAADVGGAERALDAWLMAREGESENAAQVAWQVAGEQSAGAIPTSAEAAARRTERARVLATLLDSLGAR